MQLLLISNSTMAGEPYLDYPKNEIKKFLGDKPVKALFIPYAAVTFSFDDYEAKEEQRFAEIGHHVRGIHHYDDPVKALSDGDVWSAAKKAYPNMSDEELRKEIHDGEKSRELSKRMFLTVIKTT